MRVKNLIYNSKREREKQSRTKIMRNNSKFIYFRILNCVTINQIFWVFCSISQSFVFLDNAFVVNLVATNVSNYISSHTKKWRECEKANIIYRLADCTCSSFTYKITFWPSSQWISAIFFSTLCSFCLVNQKLLLLHMDW